MMVKLNYKQEKQVNEILKDVSEEKRKAAMKRILRNPFKLIQIFRKRFCRRCQLRSLNSIGKKEMIKLNQLCDRCRNILMESYKEE